MKRRLARLRRRKHIAKSLDRGACFAARLAAHFQRHQRSGRHANRAAMTGEFEGLDGLRREFHRQFHFVAAGRVVTLDGRRCVGKRSKISRALAVVEDDLLVKFFDVHAKKA